MAHMKRFAGIPMSKSMREICKEEDYIFLEKQGDPDADDQDAGFSDSEFREKREDRIRRKLEREQQEQERLKEVERQRKEKEEQWRKHVAELASKQENTLRDRALRLRDFRNFQRKVLVEELGRDPECTREMVDQLLIRM
ncbi:hypothetical protein AALO_G00225970 [Alosa alosa]|uniref:Uncharacterized protein n=2 Tax=Alosa alosa TaxID=278164 RepID=A0AAV6G588_9TELE|nr:hypothetical protein AALO_G00225970 [Alosa alosa]